MSVFLLDRVRLVFTSPFLDPEGSPNQRKAPVKIPRLWCSPYGEGFMNSNVFRSMVVMSGLTTAVEFSAILASSGSSHPWKHSPKQTKQELLDKITVKSSSTFLALG